MKTEMNTTRTLEQRMAYPESWDDVMLHEPFVLKKAHDLCAVMYFNRDCNFDELRAAGLRGLSEGWQRYNPSNGQFLTFAGWWVLAKMNQYMATNRTIHIPSYVLEKRRLVKKAEDAGVAPPFELKPHEVEHEFELLDAPVGEEGSRTLAELIPDPNDAFGDAEHAEHRDGVISAFLATLTEREREVFADAFWGGMTHAEVGKKYGLSRERVRQIVYAALERFRTETPAPAPISDHGAAVVAIMSALSTGEALTSRELAKRTGATTPACSLLRPFISTGRVRVIKTPYKAPQYQLAA